MRRTVLLITAALVLARPAALFSAAPQEPAPQPSAPPSLSLDEYATALDGVAARVRQGRLAEARADARQLLSTQVRWDEETLAPDASVLAPIAEARSEADARARLLRLERLTRALRAAGGATPGRSADPALLAGLPTSRDPEKGGTVPRLAIRPLTLPERVEAALLAAWDRLVAAVRALLDWLERLLPQRAGETGDAAGVVRAAVVFVALAIAVLLGLAVRAALRRGRSKPAPAVVESSSADDDPLSRESPEWEKHAEALAAARRFREAIRAWYHAVLTTLFRRGELQYRKGRTNWEYVASVDPRREWRAGFIALTQLFDREWYGGRASDPSTFAQCAERARELLVALRRSGDAA